MIFRTDILPERLEALSLKAYKVQEAVENALKALEEAKPKPGDFADLNTFAAVQKNYKTDFKKLETLRAVYEDDCLYIESILSNPLK